MTVRIWKLRSEDMYPGQVSREDFLAKMGLEIGQQGWVAFAQMKRKQQSVFPG